MRIRSILASAATLAAVVTGPALVAAPAAEASGTKISHSTATSRLSAAGITWSSSGNCSNRQNPSCTSFDQIYSGTIDGIITLRRASGCAIRITGGTEVGHASGQFSHYNGYKVDFAPTTCTGNYIRNTFTRVNPPSFGSEQYRSAAGNVYTYEGNHWDVYYR